MMAGYAIDFVFVLCYEILDRSFRNTANLPFPCMIQRLCDGLSVPDIFGVNKRVCAMATM